LGALYSWIFSCSATKSL